MDDVIKTVVPEDVRPKFKPVGKIDLDNLRRRKVEKEPEVEKQPVVESEPIKVQEVQTVEEVAKPVTPIIEKDLAEKEEPAKTLVPAEPEIVKEVSPVIEKIPEVTSVPVIEEKLEEKMEATPEPELSLPNGDDDVFKIRPTEFVSKINVIGQIDLAALNQTTRPKKKSKEEKRREREDKDKVRQDQKKQMKEAIIKEIRKEEPPKPTKIVPKETFDAAAKKKRNRINKEKVDINNVTSNFARPVPNSEKSVKTPSQHQHPNGNGQGQANKSKLSTKQPVKIRALMVQPENYWGPTPDCRGPPVFTRWTYRISKVMCQPNETEKKKR